MIEHALEVLSKLLNAHGNIRNWQHEPSSQKDQARLAPFLTKGHHDKAAGNLSLSPVLTWTSSFTSQESLLRLADQPWKFPEVRFEDPRVSKISGQFLLAGQAVSPNLIAAGSRIMHNHINALIF